MATETLKSTTITNRDATPAVINDGRLEKGVLKSAFGQVNTTAAVTTGSKYLLAQVPSKAMVRQVLLSCAALGGTTAHDIGVYRTTADGSAAVSAAFFGSAVSTASALTNSDVTNESGTYTLDKMEQPLWQAAGLSSDPGGMLDIVATSTATNTSGGRLGLVVNYCDNGS